MVAVNVSSVSSIWGWGGNRERVLKEAIDLCRILKQYGYHVILIPFEKNDVRFVSRVSEVANVEIFTNWTDIQSVIDFIATCHILIGEKLHSTVFSASTYTPFISLGYRPKCLDFAKSVGFEKYLIRTDEMTAEKVMKLFYNLSDNWSEMHQQLIRNVKKYRRKLRKFATQIIEDIEALPDDKWSTSNFLQNVKWRVVHQTDRVLYHHAYGIWRFLHQPDKRE